MEQHRVLQTFFSPIRDHQNSIIGAITFTLDITKETEQAMQLEASEHELNNLIMAMSLGLASFHIIENEEGAIVDFQISRFNPQFASLFQLTPSIEGETLLHLFPDLDKEWFAILQQVVRSGTGQLN
jgi:PAS domain-containing protein